MNWTRNGLAVCAVTALLILAACSKEAGKEPEPLVTVQTTTVKRGPLQQVITSEAVLFPVQQSAVTPKISAPVLKFFVNRGSRVREGQLLATLENRDLQGALAQAQANYESTTKATLPADIKKAELDLAATKQEMDAEQKLFQSREQLFQQGALPRKELDQARVALTQAQNQYALAQQHLEALQSVGASQTKKAAAGQLQTAEANVSYSEIRAPISGVVTERPLYPGETAAAGTPMLTIMDVSSVIAKAHIPQDQAALLHVGDAAEITGNGSDEKFPARITVVSPATDPSSTTVEVWALAANAKAKLRPGTTVKVSIQVRKVPDALAIPASAVIKTDAGLAVMAVVTDNKDPKAPVERAKQQPVKIGVRSGDYVQVTDGLEAGQTIVASGAYGIPDNTQIRRQEEKPNAEQVGNSDNHQQAKGNGRETDKNRDH